MDLLNLLVKITADSGDAESKISGFAGKATKTIGGIAKIGGAAIAAAGAAVVAVTKQAVDSYAEYEQLAGGIQTLYGENSEAAQMMMDNASKAWQTAGMSANEYMETAIQSSAALINSLGGDTEKAAELMDMSITDMSDNVNKMGTTMEAVQNAYRGFSRGNFTMLDNLALGFAGTKEGMQELLDKASELSGFEYDISSYSDIVEAIHVVQTEMGITGTTAKEASSTIQGSFNATKAAWKNLLTAFGSGEDVKGAIDKLVSSAKTYVRNLIPVIKTALVGIADFVKEIGPVIIEELPGLIQELLPELLNAAVALVGALVEALPGILVAIWDSIKTLFGTFMDWLREQNPELATTLDGLIEAGRKVVEFFMNFKENMAQIWENIKTAVSEKIDGIKEKIASGIEEAKQAAIEKVESIKNGIVEKFENIRDRISEIIDRIKSLFNFSWEFPKPKLPHFSVNWRDLGIISIPDVSIEWYKKAYDNPYMFTKPTVMGFGDGVGGEMVYGHQSLLNDIKTAMRDTMESEQPVTIIVQSVLDGKVIGETATKWQRQQARAFG